MLGYTDAIKKYGKLIPINDARKILRIRFDKVEELIDDGYLKGLYLKVGEDIDSKSKGRKGQYYFIERRTKKLMNGYLSIKDLAESHNINEGTLYRYIRNGYFGNPDDIQPFPGSHRYDQKVIMENIERVRSENQQRIGNINKPKAFDYLNETTKEQIKAFIDHKLTGAPIRLLGVKIETQMLSDKEWVMNIIGLLSNMIVKIICIKCGITHIDEDPDKFKKACQEFDAKKIKPNDIEALGKIRSPLSHYVQTYFYFRPFLVYLGMIEQRKFKTKKILRKYWDEYCEQLLDVLDSIPSKKPSNKKNLQINDILNQFDEAFEEQFYEESDWENEDEEETPKVFYTRTQIIEIYNRLINNLFPVRLKDPLQFALIFMISCFIGLRTKEIRLVSIHDFVLDENGFVKASKDGWGVLSVKRNKSKKHKSPSHPKLKTLVVPELVQLINSYLRSMYSKYPDVPKGRGFLFRPSWNNNKPYKSNSHFQIFINKIREYCYCLSPDQRQVLRYYDGRHSLNELIKTSILPRSLSPYQQRSAAIQMRHRTDPNRVLTVEEAYSQDPSPSVFRAILSEALNFPWNLEELTEWEKKKGYYENSHDEVNEMPKLLNNDLITNISERPEIESTPTETKITEDKELNDLKKELEKLRRRPKTLSVSEWDLERRRINNKIALLEQKAERHDFSESKHH